MGRLYGFSLVDRCPRPKARRKKRKTIAIEIATVSEAMGAD